MILQRLVIEQFRGFSSRTELALDPQFTVLVGENGAGKTSVLWALRVLLSHTVFRLGINSAKRLRFAPSDVTRNWPLLKARVDLVSGEDKVSVSCMAQKDIRPEAPKGAKNIYQVTVEAPPNVAINPPLVVYYSAHRSLAVNKGLSRERAAVGIMAAHGDALKDRELRLGEAAMLWRKDALLELEDLRPAHANHAIEEALPIFLGGFDHLRVEGTEKPRLVVDKKGTSLDLSQLSDGERGLLAVLIDLTRRLAQANPELKERAREGRAIVLIDEIDLHMHPTWQREMVSKLTATFPNCQFIATTHSPQVISEVQPESLLLLRQETDGIVSLPCGQAYGLDSNFVLEHIMGTPARPKTATKAIRAVKALLAEGNLDGARARLSELRKLLHGDDPDVVKLETAIHNLEAYRDAAHTEEE